MSSTVGIFTYARTGSNFLSNMFDRIEHLYASEIFCRDHLQFYRRIVDLLKRLSVDHAIIHSLKEIYSRELLYRHIDNIEDLEEEYNSKKIYSINLLKGFQREAYKLNKLFVFKIFEEHFNLDIRYQDVLNLTDYVIINYRRNILDCFISYHTAVARDYWCNTGVINYNTNKIIWNKAEYLDFYSKITTYLHTIYRLSHNKRTTLICYEDIHELDNFATKIAFVKHKLESMGLSCILNEKELFKKQYDQYDYKEFIQNIEEFKIDYQDIPKYIDERIFN